MHAHENREDERLKYIQTSLKRGTTREETAKTLGYKSWRGLDIYMRRKGMKWDQENKLYYHVDNNIAKEVPMIDASSPTISRIISKFKDTQKDPVMLAKDCGFKDHRELSSYMGARGFFWSPEKNNYEYAKIDDEEINETNCHEQMNIDIDAPDIDKYMKLLDILVKNKERLLSLLLPSSFPGTIPRYVVPGVTRTKSFYMSDSLSRLINEYSKTMNISQKEIIEAALIEFLRKYSYKDEVDALLSSSF